MAVSYFIRLASSNALSSMRRRQFVDGFYVLGRVNPVGLDARSLAASSLLELAILLGNLMLR